MNLSFAERWESLQARIALASALSGRAAEAITVVGVSKRHSISACEEALRLGISNLGENYVVEWLEKADALEQYPQAVTWHFIGTLQSRKAKRLVGRNVLVHSLDRASLAEALHTAGQRMKVTTDCLIQVNASSDPRKGGVELRELSPFLESLQALQNIQVRGLMCIPAAGLSVQESHEVYRSVRNALPAVQDVFPNASILSMGMSNDFEIAIAEGATHIRVGTALFGPREAA